MIIDIEKTKFREYYNRVKYPEMYNYDIDLISEKYGECRVIGLDESINKEPIVYLKFKDESVKQHFIFQYHAENGLGVSFDLKDRIFTTKEFNQAKFIL